MIGMTHVLSMEQYADRTKLEEIFRRADMMKMQLDKTGPSETLKGKLIYSLFYEPSTRTRFSFETAAVYLGAYKVESESAGHFSSAAKGESLEHTIRVLSGYRPSAIILRHTDEGAAARAAKVSRCPIINGGDGIYEHPTQALLDAYTIQKMRGSIDGLRIAFGADLLHSRVVHSNIHWLGCFPGVTAYFVSPDAVKLPEHCRALLKEKKVEFYEVREKEELPEDLDVWYWLRVQEERIKDPAIRKTLEECKPRYVIDKAFMDARGKKTKLMHPLPIKDEINMAELDDDPRTLYFIQAENGLYIRMALLDMLFGDK